MAYFLKTGTTYQVTTKESMDLHEKLPVGNYVIKKNEMSGQLYLETIDNFEIAGKIYGDTMRNTKRILHTFDSRTNSTGVILSGEKGSGKTLLAKMLAVTAAKQDIPTIVINAPWAGDKFNSFMQMIDQPCVILFDEFEKVYDRDSQESILTLLDGVFPSKKLFVLTCNDKYRIDSHMRNRPGRIFYMLDFKGLDQDFIIEYCNDNLLNKSHIQQICKVAMMFDQFNFDMLKSLVEEMNRYNEAPQESLRMLNAKPEFSGESNYAFKLQVNGEFIEDEAFDQTQWSGNPLYSRISIDYKSVEKDEDGDSVWESSRFETSDLKSIDSSTGKFIFSNAFGEKIVLTKIVPKNFQFYDAL